MRKYHLTINLTKCIVFMTEIKYLGHIVSNGNVCPDSHKLSAISCLKVPHNKKELRQFLGLTGYFRIFL